MNVKTRNSLERHLRYATAENFNRRIRRVRRIVIGQKFITALGRRTPGGDAKDAQGHNRADDLAEAWKMRQLAGAGVDSCFVISSSTD